MGELLNLVGLSTGVVLYAMLLAMVLRARRGAAAQEPGDRLPLSTAVLGLVWNVCALPIYELHNIGIHAPVRYLSVVGFSALGFLPAVVVHSVLRAANDRSRAVAKRVLISIAYVASILATVLHLMALGEGGAVPAALGLRLLTYVFVALVLPVALVARRQPGARRAVWVAALAAFAVSALHLAQLHTGRDPWPVSARPPCLRAPGAGDHVSGLSVRLCRSVLEARAHVDRARCRHFSRHCDTAAASQGAESLVIVGPATSP